MNDWLFVLWALTVATFGALALFRWREKDRADHAKCIALMSSVTSNKVVANAFRDAAVRVDGIDGIADMQRLRSSVWVEDGPNLTSLWLREQAEKIDPPSDIPYFR